MASIIHQIPVAMDTRQSAPTSLLRAMGKLLQAPDADAVAIAARDLLAMLNPGAELHECGLAVAYATTGHYRVVPLSDHEALVVFAAPDDHEQRSLLDQALDLVAARADVLSRQTALTGSIEQLSRAERLQRALFAIADQASTTDTPIAAMFRSLHDTVGSLMYAENFFIALYDAHHDSVRFSYFADSVDPDPPFAGIELPMADIMYSPTWHVIREGRPLMGSLPAIRSQVREPVRAAGTECVDWLGAPLLRGNDVTGCVAVQSYDVARHYDTEDQSLLVYVAQHIQTALERRLAHVQLERRVEDRTQALRNANQVLQQQVLERQRGERLQAALFRIAELASTADSLGDFYAAVHRVVGGLLYARNFRIALLSEDGTELTFPYSVDEHNRHPEPRKLSEGLIEHVVRHSAALLANAPDIARLAGQAGGYHDPDLVCWLGVPLVWSEQPVGVLVVQSYSHEHTYSLSDQGLLTFVSYHIANALDRVRGKESLRGAYSSLEKRVAERTRALIRSNRHLREQITERERIESRLKYETLHDSLTGLPNRTLLLQRLEHALKRYHSDPHKGFAVLFMDLDRFKVINDSVGHMIGDDLLFQAGSRIRACLKSEDVVARLGGDEFGVLLERVNDADQARRVAERIIESFGMPFRLASRELFTSTSIGITLAAPRYRHPDDLLRDADSAMYRAKADGRQRCAVFDEDLLQHATTLLEVGNDLRRSLQRSEFVPYYQPIIDIDRGVVMGYEALMRWQHPQRGVLLPADFLHVAEDIGISEAIDWQVFEQVFRDARIHAKVLAADRRSFVAINLSARHFHDPDLDRRLLELMESHALPATRLRVEVTERALLENTPAVNHTLSALRAAGIKIALDDFGTGYSSLAYLHRYPLHSIKIDQSFVTGLTGADESSSKAVVRAILAMADTLSMQVVAEGVETRAQHELLCEMGCRYMQGFLYSEAQPAEAWTGGNAPAVRL